jgi:MYXO-CTERM domain-containing protein
MGCGVQPTRITWDGNWGVWWRSSFCATSWILETLEIAIPAHALVQKERERDMKNRIVLGAATAAFAFAPMAMADFEISFDVTDTPGGGYVNVEEHDVYAGRAILMVGYRDVVVRNETFTPLDFVSAWGMTLPAYGTNFWSLAAAISLGLGDNALDDVLYDVSGYAAEVSAPNTWFGEYNIGAGFFGDTGYIGISGEQYFILEGDPIPAPGALALLGLAGIAGVRRRRR